MSGRNELGLYVHVPFCRAKCSYCGFFSEPFADETSEVWLNHLFKELDQRLSDEMRTRTKTLFVGGGNPTVLPTATFGRFVEGLQQRLTTSPITEWTFETNPETLTQEHLAMLRAVPGLRLSLGLQRLRDDELARIGRATTADSGIKALEKMFQITDNIGVDLILGVPGLPSAAHGLDRLLQRFPIAHVSAYFLTVEPGTPLARNVEAGRFPDPAECGPEELFEVRDVLRQHGLQQYEISNFARPGRECRHNLHYWHQGDYLGIGPAAVSTLENVRIANPESLQLWLRGDQQVERLSPLDRRREYLMLRLRLLQEGFSPSLYADAFEIPVAELVHNLERLVEKGDLLRTGDGYALSPSGMSFANRIIAELF